MNMKALTDKQRQWLWFAALWCGGLTAVFVRSNLAPWLI